MVDPGLEWKRDPQERQTTKPHSLPHDEHVYPADPASTCWAVLQFGQRTVGMGATLATSLRFVPRMCRRDGNPDLRCMDARHPRVNRTARSSVIPTERETPLLDDVIIREFLATAYPRIVAAVTMVAGDRATAEDAVQEALARAWERSSRGETIDSLPAWVARVALNLSKSRLRSLRVESRARERLARPKSHDLDTAERLAIDGALARLPRRQREVTVLRYYLGMNVAETASTLRVSEGTVKTSLHRARTALAAALGEPNDEEVADGARAR